MSKRMFRVWCKDKKEWEQDNIVLSECGDLIDLQHHITLNPETHIICLYTGLTDKYGISIFEGDVVKCTEIFKDKVTSYVSQVWWESCCFLVKESDDCDVELGMFDGTGSVKTEIEVVGNIYQNKVFKGDMR